MDRPPYQAVHRLFHIAGDNWAEIDGEAAFGGVDLLNLRLDRFCNSIMYWVLQRVDDREVFVFQLNQPVVGRVRQADVERELDDFSSFINVMGG